MRIKLLSTILFIAIASVAMAQCTVTFTNVVNSSCHSSNTVLCDGKATAVVTPGGTYVYSWSNNQPVQTASFLCAGTYTVKATGFSSQSGSFSCTNTVTITQPAAITAVTSSTNTSCFTCTDGSVMATASGGTGPYVYSWQPVGLTGQVLNNLPASSYYVIITDSKGCSFANTTPVIVQPGPLTGISESVAPEITVYPNPVEDMVFIQSTSELFTGETKVSVYDLTGKCINSYKINLISGSAAKLEVATLPKGMYFLMMENKGIRATSRFTKN